MDGSQFSTKTKIPRWNIVFVLLTISVLIVACGGDGEEEEVQVVPCESQAFIDSVKVVEKGGDYYALIVGNYPDACTKTTSTQQKMDGDTVTITLCTTQPEGLACAQMLTPFEEEVQLETEDLDSGTFTVDVNGTTMTFTVD